MKKLLFVFAMAAICAFATSSFPTVQSANEELKQTLVSASAEDFNVPEGVKKEDNKKKPVVASSCCQAKKEKAECTEAQQKSCTETQQKACTESKKECPKEVKCSKK